MQPGLLCFLSCSISLAPKFLPCKHWNTFQKQSFKSAITSFENCLQIRTLQNLSRTTECKYSTEQTLAKYFVRNVRFELKPITTFQKRHQNFAGLRRKFLGIKTQKISVKTADLDCSPVCSIIKLAALAYVWSVNDAKTLRTLREKSFYSYGFNLLILCRLKTNFFGLL